MTEQGSAWKGKVPGWPVLLSAHGVQDTTYVLSIPWSVSRWVAAAVVVSLSTTTVIHRSTSTLAAQHDARVHDPAQAFLTATVAAAAAAAAAAACWVAALLAPVLAPALSLVPPPTTAAVTAGGTRAAAATAAAIPSAATCAICPSPMLVSIASCSPVSCSPRLSACCSISDTHTEWASSTLQVSTPVGILVGALAVRVVGVGLERAACWAVRPLNSCSSRLTAWTRVSGRGTPAAAARSAALEPSVDACASPAASAGLAVASGAGSAVADWEVKLAAGCMCCAVLVAALVGSRGASVRLQAV